MREEETDIQLVLDACGETLTFPTFTLKGIPGQNVYNITSLDSPYDVERQEVIFQLSYNDFKTRSLAKGTTFTYAVSTTIYSFIIVSYIYDLMGWIELKVDITGVV
jgi:hypothetical protein